MGCALAYSFTSLNLMAKIEMIEKLSNKYFKKSSISSHSTKNEGIIHNFKNSTYTFVIYIGRYVLIDYARRDKPMLHV